MRKCDAGAGSRPADVARAQPAVSGGGVRRAVVLAALALLPAVAWAKGGPTPPPPAPHQKLGEVKVIEQTRGTRTIVDSAGRVHVVMNHVTPQQRQEAALRARASRQAAAQRHEKPASSPATHP